MEIKGQTAYISGGASGLGEATAQLLAQAGATVILIQAVLIILIIAILEYQGQLKDK